MCVFHFPHVDPAHTHVYVHIHVHACAYACAWALSRLRLPAPALASNSAPPSFNLPACAFKLTPCSRLLLSLERSSRVQTRLASTRTLPTQVDTCAANFNCSAISTHHRLSSSPLSFFLLARHLLPQGCHLRHRVVHLSDTFTFLAILPTHAH